MTNNDKHQQVCLLLLHVVPKGYGPPPPSSQPLLKDLTEFTPVMPCRDRQSAVVAFQEAFRAAKANRLMQSWRGAPLQPPAVPTGSTLMATADQAAQLLAALLKAGPASLDTGEL